VTITTDDVPTSVENVDAEALFPEARRRRRIRVVAGAIVLSLVVGAAGLIYGITSSSGSSPPTAPSVPAAPGPPQISASTILRASLAVGSAHETWISITSYPGCSPPVSGVGVIDLKHVRQAVTVSSKGCPSVGEHLTHHSYRIMQIGSTSFSTRQPQETWGYGPGKTWVGVPQNPSANELTSAQPLNVLKAVSGPFMRVGTENIEGTATTQFVDSASLASMQTVTATLGPDLIGAEQPTLKQIPIMVNVWIDAQHRVRQISTWEPLYTQNYTDGSSVGGRQIVPLSSPAPDAPPRQQGFLQTTLDLSQFGTAVQITPPPAASVAGPQTPRICRDHNGSYHPCGS
jgi:hypothetical protein